MANLIVNCIACGIEVKFTGIDLTSKKERDNVSSRMRSTLCEACTILNQNDDDCRMDWRITDQPWFKRIVEQMSKVVGEN